MFKLDLKLRNIYLIAVIFSIVFLVIPPNGLLNGDEEMYFKFSSDYIFGSPNNYSAYISQDNAVSHRFLFNFLCGGMISTLGYEYTQVFGRLAVICLFSFSLFKLFSYFRFSVLEAFIVLTAFIFFDQTYYSGLQFFKGFLASDLAYAFGLLSISSVLSGKLNTALIFLIVSTYFHFLIGGYLFLFYSLFLLSKNIRKARNLLIYLISVTPLIIILYNATINDTFHPVDPNWIYSYIRHPHHLLPFRDITVFIEEWLPGFIASQILFGAILYIRFSKRREYFSDVVSYIIYANIYLIIAFVISYIDKDYSFAKLYLFRPASLVLFLTLIYMTKYFWIELKISVLYKYKIFGYSIFMFWFAFCVINYPKRFNYSVSENKEDLIDFVKTRSEEGSVFVLQHSILDFERRTGRYAFFLNKVIPTDDVSIGEWYKRRLFHQDLFDCKISNANDVADYIILSGDKRRLCGYSRVVFENAEYTVLALGLE